MSVLASASTQLKLWSFNGQGLSLSGTNDFSANTLEKHFNCISWNHTNQVVGVSALRNKLYLVQASNGQLLSSIPFSASENIEGSINALCFSHNSRYMAASADASIQIWDLKRRSLKHTLTYHRNVVKCLQFLPDGRLASGDASGALRICDAHYSPSSDLTTDKHHGMQAMAVSPSAMSVACGYDDGSVAIWDPETHLQLYDYQLHSGLVPGIAYSPKNPRLLCTCGSDGQVILVDTVQRSGIPAASFVVGEALTSLTFNENSIHSAVGTASGYILVYDWRNLRKPVVQVSAHAPEPVRALKFQVTFCPFCSRSYVTSCQHPSAPPSNTPKRPAASDVKASVDRTARSQSAPVANGLSLADRMTPEVKPGVRTLKSEPTIDTTSQLEISNITEPSYAPTPQPLHSVVKKASDVKSHAGTPIVDRHTPGSTYTTPAISRKGTEMNPTLTDGITRDDLNEAMDLLRYDIHREVQDVIKEQVRQFAMAKVLHLSLCMVITCPRTNIRNKLMHCPIN